MFFCLLLFSQKLLNKIVMLNSVCRIYLQTIQSYILKLISVCRLHYLSFTPWALVSNVIDLLANATHISNFLPTKRSKNFSSSSIVPMFQDFTTDLTASLLLWYNFLTSFGRTNRQIDSTTIILKFVRNCTKHVDFKSVYVNNMRLIMY